MVAAMLVAAAVLVFRGTSGAQVPERSPAPRAQVKGDQPPGGPGGFGPGMFLAPRIVEEADTDKDSRVSAAEAQKFVERVLREADTDKKGSIDVQTLARAINGRLGPPPENGAPNNFGPGSFLAPQLLTAIDSNKDGRLSLEEASRAVEKFFLESDTAKKGSFDSDTLAQALNLRIGPPPGFGPGGPGGPMGAERKLVKTFDKDGDGRLSRPERQAARESLKKDQAGRGPGRPGFGPPPGFGMGGGEDREPAKPALLVKPSDVKPIVDKPLYDPTVVRTFFLDIEDKDWEDELADFYKSDVEIPATLTVDGKRYPGVGIHFRGMSSYFTVAKGKKRSLNLAIDFTERKAQIGGSKTLNLLNSHEDPTFLHTVLYSHIARQYIPAPKSNFVRLVINGESWGLYVNTQQFDKAFLAENYPDGGKGARWKVQGSPGGDGGLAYVGEDVAQYKRRYQIKSSDEASDWKALITLCRTLSETPLDRLEEALKPILDVDGALWFLALENALINGDGYWIRASDYTIYRDLQGKFHIIPHDMNETFGPAMMMGPGGPGGPGGRMRPGGGGPGGGGPGGFGGGGRGPGGGPRASALELDPLVGLNDLRKPLRSKLLAVPALRERYLRDVRTIAEKWLDWQTLGPVVANYRTLIDAEVEADTRKLSSTASFRKTVSDELPKADTGGGRPEISLRSFAEVRRKYLLNNPDIKKVGP